jgi:hypothetical protein
MNVELLESVRQTIVFYPDRFCAAQWAFARNAEQVMAEGARPEGFKCCIAGHVLLEGDILTEGELLEEGGFHTGGELWAQAADALALDAERCRELFFPSQWDAPYKQEYYLCGRAEEAEVAAAYIDYFVSKYGERTDRPAEQAETTDAKRAAPTAAQHPSTKVPHTAQPVGAGERAPA